MYIHTCHCDHWHHASPFFFAKLRTFSVDMLSHPNFHKREHFAQELESFDSAHRLLSELMPFLNMDACLIAQILKRRPWLEQQLKQILRFQRCFSQTLQKTCFNEIGEPLVFIGLVFFDGQAVEYLSVELVENGEPH